MQITILTVGAKPGHEIATLIDSYQKRLPRHIRVTWRFIKHGPSSDPTKSIQQESETILSAIPKDTHVILLDETGRSLTSPQLSTTLFDGARGTVFIIGGAYGVSQSVKDSASTTLSLGKLVYPHQIVRLVLSEQIYRCYTISTGHPYHHE